MKLSNPTEALTLDCRDCPALMWFVYDRHGKVVAQLSNIGCGGGDYYGPVEV